MKTKAYALIIVLCTLSLCTLTGCKRDKNEPDTFVSNVARPSWTVPADYDYSSSMTAVVKVDLKAQYPEMAADWQLTDNDLIAAFIGETCLGVAQPQEGLFFLFVAGPNDQMVNEKMVNLKYYSAFYKNLFEVKNAFPFQNDANLGTIADPFIPTFVVAK